MWCVCDGVCVMVCGECLVSLVVVFLFLVMSRAKSSLKVREHKLLGPYVESLSKLAVSSFKVCCVVCDLYVFVCMYTHIYIYIRESILDIYIYQGSILDIYIYIRESILDIYIYQGVYIRYIYIRDLY